MTTSKEVALAVAAVSAVAVAMAWLLLGDKPQRIPKRKSFKKTESAT